jgi:hypothetical protein
MSLEAFRIPARMTVAVLLEAGAAASARLVRRRSVTANELAYAGHAGFTPQDVTRNTAWSLRRRVAARELLASLGAGERERAPSIVSRSIR